MGTISLISNNALTLQGSGEVTWGIALSDIVTKIDNDVPDSAKIKKITLNFSGTAYNNGLFGALNEYAVCGLTNSDSDASTSTSGGTGGENLFKYGPFEIGAKKTVNLTSQSIEITKYFNSYKPHSVQNTSYTRLSVAFTSKATYKKTYTFSLSLVVEYETQYYTVTFKNYDGTVLEEKSVVRNSTPSYTGETPVPYVQDWQYVNVFSGWDKTLGAITADTTYTAVFTPTLRTYLIQRHDRNELAKEVVISGFGVYNYGDTVTLTAEHSLPIDISWQIGADNIFKGLSLTFKLDDNTLSKLRYGDISIDNYATLESCILLNVSAEYKTYNANFNESPENGGNIKQAIYDDNGEIIYWLMEDVLEIQYPKNTLTINAVPNKGYRFVKWSDGVTDNPRNVTITEDVTFTAIFEKITFNVEIEQLDAKVGTITGAVSGVYEYGTELTLTANLNYGYVFERWVITGEVSSTDNPVSFIVKGDTEVLVDYEVLQKYYCTFTSDGNGKIVGAETGYYYDGTELSITAVPDEGHKFVKWSDGDTNPTKTIILNSETTYIATFKKKEAIVYYTELNEHYGQFILTNKMGEEVSGQYRFSYGEELTLTFIPEKSYKFTNFTIEVTTENNPLSISPGEHLENPLTFSIVEEGTVDITINFQNKKYYYLTLSNINIHKINNEIVNELIISGQFFEDDVLELQPELPSSLYKFVKWSGDISGTEVPKVYTVTKDATLRAELKELQMKFKSVKILHHSTNETASSNNPLIGGEDYAIAKVQIALE